MSTTEAVWTESEGWHDVDTATADKMRAETVERLTPAPCAGCGHSKRRHIDGAGLCLVASCRLCLIYRP